MQIVRIQYAVIILLIPLILANLGSNNFSFGKITPQKSLPHIIYANGCSAQLAGVMSATITSQLISKKLKE